MHLAPRFINDFFIENQIISYLACYFSMRQILYECTSLVAIIVLGLIKGGDVCTVSTQLHFVSYHLTDILSR